MELVTAKSISYAKLPLVISCINGSSSPAPYFPYRANVLGFDCLSRKLQCSVRQLRNLGAIHASGIDTSSINVAEKWVFEPIDVSLKWCREELMKLGLTAASDGDSRHLSVKIERPNAFEIGSNEVTIGGAPDKADIVIPVPTVSGLHARIQKTEENLLITDLDSTNGTFIGEKRLKPGVTAAATPGSIVTFGDTHLAIFRILKFEVVEPSNESEAETEVEEGTGEQTTS